MKGFALDSPWTNSDTHGVSFYGHVKEDEKENTES